MLLPRACAADLSVPLVLCTKVSTSLGFTSPLTLKVGFARVGDVQTVSVNQGMFSKNPFTSLLTSKQLREFTVLDVQLDDPAMAGQRAGEVFAMADVEVMRNDSNDDSIIVRSHLGLLLKPGDMVLGYDLRSVSFNSEELDKYVGVR